jgi:hypothetical protein
MTKLNWNRPQRTSAMSNDYWTNPRTGFDKGWHIDQQNKQLKAERERELLGIHVDHELERIKSTSGPHHGKLTCKTCNNKFIKWLPKEAF